MNIYDYVVIRIKAFSPNKIIKILRRMNVQLYSVKVIDRELLLKVKNSDLERISKIYDYEIVRRYGIGYLLFHIKRMLLKVCFVGFLLLLILIWSHFIINVNVSVSDANLRNRLLLFLEDVGIKRFHLRINDNKISDIKELVMKYFEDDIEWINIQRNGMVYDIQLQQRVIKEKNIDDGSCHIVAKKDGVIKRIISSSGDAVVDINDSVKKGDILISGDIKADESVKASICAKGRVYASTWYTIDISIPKKYDKTEYLEKKRYNLELLYNNKSVRIFKDRLDEFKSFKKKLLSLFGIEMFLIKDVSTKTESVYYTEEELDNKVSELVLEKMKSVIGDDGLIIRRNVLKKVDNDSKIDIELFIVAEEEIGQMIEY